MKNPKHSWKEKKKEGYKIIQVCSVCGCLKQRVSTKLRMAIVGSKDYYSYSTAWQYTTINKTTLKAPPCNPTP